MVQTALPPGLANSFIRLVYHWDKQKGPEWTAKRIKTLWQVALLYRSGNVEQIPEVMRSARIKTSGILPCGIERILVENFSQAQRPSAIRRASLPFSNLYRDSAD